MTASAVAAVCAAATFTVVISTPAGAADDPQWSMGGQNISNTRSNPAETILSPTTVGNLQLNWAPHIAS